MGAWRVDSESSPSASAAEQTRARNAMRQNTGVNAAQPTEYALNGPRSITDVEHGSKSVHRTELVPIQIAKIGQVKSAGTALAYPRWVLTGDATSSQTGRMPGVRLSG
jgi:hypothetical protein